MNSQTEDIKVNGKVVVNKSLTQRIFEKVENVSDLEPILKARLPISAGIYNVCRIRADWSNEITWYVLGGEISSGAWIVSTYTRDDFGLEISVSRPAEATITEEIREAFSQAAFIDWAKPFFFAAIDIELSKLISEISVREKGNYTHIHPCNLYYMDIEDGVRLSEEFNHDEGVEVKSISSTEGEKFMLSTWKYATKGSDQYLKKVLNRNLSTGVYEKGKIVSGSLFAVHGLISMLYTLNDYRGKGYAKSNMHLLMKRCSEIGLVPCCTVELRNEASKGFQTKIGFKLAGVVDYVVFENPGF